jgi:chromosome segregation ATPase
MNTEQPVNYEQLTVDEVAAWLRQMKAWVVAIQAQISELEAARLSINQGVEEIEQQREQLRAALEASRIRLLRLTPPLDIIFSDIDAALAKLTPAFPLVP